VSAKNGKIIWQYAFKTSQSLEVPNSTPSVDGKFIYALGVEGVLYCIKAKNGKLRWKKDLIGEYDTEVISYGYSGSPVIDGELIILNVNTAGIALHKKTGDLVWASPIHTGYNKFGYHSTPVVYMLDGKKYALLTSVAGLYSVDVMTGEQQWFYELFHHNNVNTAYLVVYDNMVFVSAAWSVNKGVLLEITENEPGVIWQNVNMRNAISTCVYLDGYLYGYDGHIETAELQPLRCIDTKTGEVLWEKNMKKASLIASDGKLIILDDEGMLIIAEATPSSYREISRCDVLDGEQKWRELYTLPVLCNGKIYCRNGSGDLVCIDVSK
jgi:outer membrane protein assembly factor BamB